jgi:streptomycin 6-kinase
MREWTPELLVGDPLLLGGCRCRRLAELTGVDPELIWQWGFLERMSTGLLCMRVGLEGAREMLAVADAWARGVPA